MAIKSKIYSTDNYVLFVLFHIVLGILLYEFDFLNKIYFVFILVFFLFRILFSSKEDKTIEILLACAYFTGIEVLFRMTKSGLSYEASKYLVIIFTTIGIFYKGISGKSYPYFVFLILLVPAIIVASITLTYGARFRTNVAFVLSGPVCLGIASLFCFDRKITQKQVLDILFYILLPCITTTTYLFLYTPSLKGLLSGTASNSAASGGFGPNQVATILGLGIFVIIVRLFLQSYSIRIKILNLIILGAMSFRALVTFSRGGVVAAVITVLIFLSAVFYRSSKKQASQLVQVSLLLGFALIIVWGISSNQTDGLIEMRYVNKDHLGREKKDITTGRWHLFVEEIDGFLESPFLGIGASRVKNKRVEKYGRHLPSHNEIGRLLSEHGVLGIIILMILVFTPISYRSRNKKNIFFYAFLGFWFATINHSGMRIAAPSFIYALCLLNVTNEKNPVHRKQITK
ncbi:MAG: O-antigen ligase family protein [Psychroserpens sp.]|uniref:O-antigen ligase family protein n=1 Tax=Psychroserpens sp. TaxID=2020870 RepID=UPI00300342DB